MDIGPGGAALVLMSALISELNVRRLVDVGQMEQALRLHLERLPPDQQEDTLNALAVLQGIQLSSGPIEPPTQTTSL